MTRPMRSLTLCLVTLLLASAAPQAFAESPAVAPGAPPAPLTLADCYRLALKQSETLAIRQELITQAETRFTQALSGILPRVSFVSTDKRQDGSGSSAFTLRNVPERKFTVSQPLFSGFREFAAMAGTKAEHHQRTLEKARAEQLLLVDVADAFYLVLEQREDLAALEMIRRALADRAEELTAREQIGRSRPSEVVSAEAQRLRLEADLELVRVQEVLARQLLAFLTGLDQIEALQDPSLPPLTEENPYLAKAVTRPDIGAVQAAAQVAEHQVGIAKADRWPTVSLDGNYYLERVGAAKDVTWDAAIKVAVPIFQGGQTQGAIAQAASQARQATLVASETQRRAVLEVRDAYASARAALARRDALARALAAAEENYRLQVDDYRRSLVNNLEVLQTLQALESARRDLLHGDYEAKRQYWHLRAAAGDLA